MRLAGLVFAISAGARILLFAQDHCDPKLSQLPGNPDGYRMREGRCEGLFIREVGIDTALLVASLTEGLEGFDPNSSATLRLAWNPPDPGRPTNLRAFSLRRRQYYRMDTARLAGQRTFDWPTILLARLQISGPQLGIVAWTSLPVGDRVREVYLPLTAGLKAPPVRPGTYELLLVPASELQEVFLTLVRAGAEGRVGATLYEKAALGYGYYPAERPVKIPLAGLNQAGFYRLSIAATLRVGGSSSTELWFHVPVGR